MADYDDEQEKPLGGSGLDSELAAAEEEQTRLEDYTKDYKRLQKQKSRKTGGVEPRILNARAFRWGEQYVNQHQKGLVAEQREDNHLHLVFNLIDKAADKLCGRLTALGGQYYCRPDRQDPKALADAEVCDKLLLALDEKVDAPTRNWELVDTLLTDGVAFAYVKWVPNAAIEPVPQFEGDELLYKFSKTGEVVTESQMNELVQTQNLPPESFEVFEDVAPVGDVELEILGGLNVFVDQSVKSLDKLAPDQAVYVANIRTKGWIEENYPDKLEDIDLSKELNIVTTTFFQEGDAVASMFLKDLIPMYQGECGEDDPEMAVVVERFTPPSNAKPRGSYCVFIPDTKILFEGDNPYEEIPLVDYHLKPVTSTFWTKDYITDLIAPQKFINKRISQLGEQANATIYDKILLGPTLTAKDIIPDRPGVIEKAIAENGQPLVQRLGGPALPSWFLESINLSTKMFSQIAGGADLFEENSFNQMRGPMAVPMLQEILDSMWGPLYQHMGQRNARVKQMMLNRVKKFYPPIRTMHYTDRNQRDEVMVFHAEAVLRGSTNFNVTVERNTLMPEFKALREAKVRDRLSGPLAVLYLDDRTGKVDKSKVANDLMMTDFGREGKEAQSRKFQNQLIERLWKGEPVPPVLQFWDHEPMLDELEAAMMTTEWLSASPMVQQLFIDRWNQHSFFLAQRAQMQQQAMMNQAIQNAVSQATQQAAAMAASDTVHATQQQVQMQKANNPNPVDVKRMIEAKGGGLKQ